MIPLFDKDGNKLEVAYRSLTLNDPDDAVDETYELHSILVDAEHTALSEIKANRDGSEIYRPRKARRILRINGAVKAKTVGKLWDMVETLNQTFDPVNAYNADTATTDKGFLALTFSRPTDDTANYASGLKALQYYARPIAIPATRWAKGDGWAMRFRILMECADPRAYAQSLSSANRTNAGTIAIDNTLASYASWPTVSISVSTVQDAVIDIKREGTYDTRTLRIDLDGFDDDTLVIDMEAKTVEDQNGSAMNRVVSGDYFWIPENESSDVTITNVSGTFDGTVTVQWRKAFA